jgi:hypothetical protein
MQQVGLVREVLVIVVIADDLLDLDRHIVVELFLHLGIQFQLVVHVYSSR